MATTAAAGPSRLPLPAPSSSASDTTAAPQATERIGPDVGVLRELGKQALVEALNEVRCHAPLDAYQLTIPPGARIQDARARSRARRSARTRHRCRQLEGRSLVAIMTSMQLADALCPAFFPTLWFYSSPSLQPHVAPWCGQDVLARTRSAQRADPQRRVAVSAQARTHARHCRPGPLLPRAAVHHPLRAARDRAVPSRARG